MTEKMTSSSVSKELADIALSMQAERTGHSPKAVTVVASDETVVVTAGASAPEGVVQECLAWLRDRYAATVEERTIREEDVYFPLPKEIRAAATAAKLPMA